MVVIFFNSNPCKTTCLLFLLCIVEYSQYRFFVVVVVVYCAIFTVSKSMLRKEMLSFENCAVSLGLRDTWRSPFPFTGTGKLPILVALNTGRLITSYSRETVGYWAERSLGCLYHIWVIIVAFYKTVKQRCSPIKNPLGRNSVNA